MPSLWAPCKEYTVICIKLFYGMLSSILNNFYRGKTVTFSGSIREICYGVPTEWVEPLRRKTAFYGFNPAERNFLSCHIAKRSGFS